ncbi:M28 family metallopeptidase [Anaeromassilibacillus senegalensis]|uniref:M28 family metallopeptidase n=1 Tax=Anaeromassilibacillus senegalensis TaxID=1673717 RepID=UPI0018A849D1|nr:M28 family metallopeptidase [Anaeromassilibacillus senegalensis]
MSHKRMNALLCAALLLFFLPSCKANEKAISNDMAFLTSDQANGRLPGTEGNEAAKNYIAEQFQTAGLDFYGTAENYFFDYKQTTHNPGRQTQVLEVSFSDGTKKEYRAGQDIPCILDTGAQGLSGLLTSDSNDPDLKHKIFLQPTGETNNSPESCLGIIQENNRLNAVAVSGSVPLIQVPSPVFSALQQNGVSVEVKGKLIAEEQTVQNVVGVKKGKTGKQAIVIGAHFDHVGSYGTSVYRGALDNASGTSVLLELARLTAQPDFPALKSDLIFCAFNGEESLMQGSNAFAQSLSGSAYQTINMINVDCVGAPSVGQLIVEEDGNKELTEKVRTFLNQEGIPCELGAAGASDYTSFTAYQIPSVGLATENESQATHVLGDTMEQIDFDLLRRIAETLRGFLPQLDQELVKPQEVQTGKYHIEWEDIPRDVYLEAVEEGRRLVKEYSVGYDETIYYPFKGFYFYTFGNYPLTTPQEVAERYPELSIPDHINGLPFRYYRDNYADGYPLYDADSMDDLPKEPTVVATKKIADTTPDSFSLVYGEDDSAFLLAISNNTIKRTLIGEPEPEFPAWDAHPECTVQKADEADKKYYNLTIPAAEDGFIYDYFVYRITPEEANGALSDAFEPIAMTEAEAETIYQAIREALEPALNSQT